jgi:hypothetical protein
MYGNRLFIKTDPDRIQFNFWTNRSDPIFLRVYRSDPIFWNSTDPIHLFCEPTDPILIQKKCADPWLSHVTWKFWKYQIEDSVSKLLFRGKYKYQIAGREFVSISKDLQVSGYVGFFRFWICRFRNFDYITVSPTIYAVILISKIT